MCCCGKPTINGTVGYRWNTPDGAPGVYPVNPPDVGEREVLLFDEPGRCGGCDSHSHHYRVVKNCGHYLLVRHGGGDRRIHLSNGEGLAAALATLDSNGRYWVLGAIYHAQASAADEARDAERALWRRAAAEKRIKTRKFPRRGVKVWIEDAAIAKAEGR